MKVIEIFKSIDGEGKRAGLPTTFVRLFGCNCRCSYCDTPYSLTGNEFTEMSVEEIVEQCLALGVPSITVTGGEPLIHREIEFLLSRLNEYFDVNVETNGTVNPSMYHHLKNTWFTVDYKCPSSGEESKMNTYAFTTLREEDVLKFVVGSDEDLNRAYEIINQYKPLAQIYFSPIFGFDGSRIVEFMLANRLHGTKVQLQIHKYLWDKDKRGV